MRPMQALPLALAAVALVALWRAAESARTARPRRHNAVPPVDPDCAVSECGADGMPLSSYAG